MKLTTLLENTAIDPALVCQHGLSQYLEVNGRRILFDAGPSAASVENARRLGVDPGACVVLEDSFNGIKAAAAGGFNPVMIPDQDQPDEEIRNLLTACCDSLTDVIGLFENGSLSLKQP